MRGYFLNTDSGLVHRAGCGHVPPPPRGPNWKSLGQLADWDFALIEAELYIPAPRKCPVCS